MQKYHQTVLSHGERDQGTRLSTLERKILLPFFMVFNVYPIPIEIDFELFNMHGYEGNDWIEPLFDNIS